MGLKGVLVAFEGIDGSGLTTHSKLLVERLRREGFKAGYTKEPTWGPVGRLIRELLLEQSVDHEVMALLYAADRLWHLRVRSCLGMGVLEALGEGFVVVVDRYKYSSMAYQSLGTDVGWIGEVNRGAPEADIIVYIDIPVSLALERIAARRLTFYYETYERLTRIKENFKKILENAEERGVKVVRIRGTDEEGKPRAVEEVHEEIYRQAIDRIKSLKA
ncbi:MAG: dTMP kinase [Thermoprotei archaeon]|nr:dTMP kinase [Thermoprotei archaeon]